MALIWKCVNELAGHPVQYIACAYTMYTFYTLHSGLCLDIKPNSDAKAGTYYANVCKSKKRAHQLFIWGQLQGKKETQNNMIWHTLEPH